MKETKERIATAIDRARTDLEDALYELEKLPIVSEDGVSFAAHALNNYLTVTGGTVELLRLVLDDHPDPQVRNLLGALQHSTDLMTHTVGQMRSASIGRDAKILHNKIDLQRVVERFTTFYQTMANPKRIDCLFAAHQGKALAWTDPVMAAVVLDNLLSNAVKYSEPSSRIWVTVTLEEDGVVCEVRDEGPGISPEDQEKLFQRGSRLTARPTAGEPSTGYGLAVTKEFVEKLDGEIWCESVLGEGSRFFFRLPRHQEHLHGPGRETEFSE